MHTCIRYIGLCLLHLVIGLMPLDLSAVSAGFNLRLYNEWSGLGPDSLINLGKRYLDANRADSAVMCLSVVANRRYNEHFDQREADAVCRALNNIGYIYYYNFHDYDLSLQYLKQARDVAEKYDFVHLLPHISLTQSYIYLAEAMLRLNFGDMSQVLAQFKTAYSDALRANATEIAVAELNSMLNIAFTYGLMGEIRAEIASFEQADYPASVPLVNVTRTQLEGIKLFSAKDFEGAIGKFKMMERPDYSESSIDLQMIMAYDDMAFVQKAKGDYAAARALYDRILKIAKRNNSRDIEASTYVNLHDLMRLEGNPTAANAYMLRFYEVRDSILYSADAGTFDEVRFFDEYQKVQRQVQSIELKRIKEKTLTTVISIITAIVLLSFLILLMAYRNVRRKNKLLYASSLKVLQLDDERKTRQKQERKYSYNPIPDDRKDEIMQRVIEVMDCSPEVYADDFSLNRLAELVDAKYREVSQIINEKLGKTFHQLLNEYRVNEACRRMNDSEKYGNLTVEAIGASVGIKSRSNFSATFKKITGLSPSEYQKISKNPK